MRLSRLAGYLCSSTIKSMYKNHGQKALWIEVTCRSCHGNMSQGIESPLLYEMIYARSYMSTYFRSAVLVDLLHAPAYTEGSA